jgi:type II secretory pathway component GspD/PulD (secretin)
MQVLALRSISRMRFPLDSRGFSWCWIGQVLGHRDSIAAPDLVGSDGETTADELIETLSKQGQLRVLAGAQLTALHNLPAQVEVGGRQPSVTGVRESSHGVSRSVERENVGLALSVRRE